MDQLLDDLREGGGVIRTVEEENEHVDMQDYIKTPTSSTVLSIVAPADSANRKRPASPVSINEAAQRVVLQKGAKRRQTAKGRQTGTTGVTNTPASSRKNLRSRSGVPSSGLLLGDNDFTVPQVPKSIIHPVHQSVPLIQQAWSPYSGAQPSMQVQQLQQQQETPLTLSPQLGAANLELLGDDTSPITPSISHEDAHLEDATVDLPMETVGTPTSETIGSPRASREGSSSLSIEQPLSLPSPSLSPVTAALTRGSSGYFSPGGGEEEISSPFELAPPGSNDGTSGLQVVRSPQKQVSQQEQQGYLMEIPHMIDSFDAMPPQVQSYVLYQLLRRCSKTTLQMVASVVNPALKCDFISLLPLELSLNIIKFLDVQSLCNAAQVCKRWRIIIDSDEWTWKRRFEEDGYNLEEGELERAITEGWGYQDPKGNDDRERDIKANLQTARLSMATPRIQKRKTRAMVKQQKKKQEAVEKLGKEEFNELLSEMSNNDWPLGALEPSTALTHIMGLPSLRILHLYKSIYRRHHLIRKSWTRTEINPRHISFRGHQRHVVTCLQFDTDKILTGSDDNNINVYDTNTGALRKTLVGHEGGVWALQYEGNTLVSGSTDRTVRVWDIAKGECTQIFHGHTSTVRCLQILMPTKIGFGLNGRERIMPKQPLIITGSRDSSLRIWNLPQLGDKPYIPESNTPDVASNPYFVRILQGHQHSVRAIAVHGDTLVSGSYDHTVRVWRISTGDTIHRLTGHVQKVYSVVLDHKRNRCISGSMDNLVKVWSLETGSLLFSLEGHTSLVGLLDLSHDYLVSAAADSTLRIWDPEIGQCKHILSAHTGAITCFQHDAHKVISGSDGTLKMWSVKTGQLIRDLLTDLSGVWQVKFNERRCVAAVQRDAVTYIEVCLARQC